MSNRLRYKGDSWFGIALLCLLLPLSVGCDLLFETIPDEEEYSSIYTSYWEHMSLHYPFFEEADIDWEQEKLDDLAVVNKENFHIIFTSFLSRTNDSQMKLISPRKLQYRNDTYRINYDTKKRESSVSLRSTRSQEVGIGFIEGKDIGYVSIESFSSNNDLMYLDIFEFVTTIQSGQIDKLILDIRDCDDGTLKNIDRILPIFDDTGSPYAKYRYRNSDQKNEFSDWQSIYVPPPRSAKSWEGKTVLLTGRGTLGVGEALALLMQSLDEAITMGDTTGGGLTRVNYYEFAEGYVYQYPSVSIADMNENVSYGKGIPPDELIDISSDDFGETDSVLVRAIEWLDK